MTRASPPPVSAVVAAAAAPHKKRGPKGICARGVCTNKGVIPLALFPAARALPVLPNKMTSMAPTLPAPIGGPANTAYKPADLEGPCDMCAAPFDREKQQQQQQGQEQGPFHVLRASGRGCMPVGHGVYCSAECARTALFRHPAYRHWDDTDRYVAYQTMLRDPRQPVAYACALFHDSVYCAGKRTTTEVEQSRFRVQRASEQPAVVQKDVRQELFADFFKPVVEKSAEKQHQRSTG